MLKLLLNASGLAGAAAILGVFYNKTKNEIDRPKVSVDSRDFSDKFKNELENSLKKASAKESLSMLVEQFKKDIEEKSITKDAIKFSDYVCSVWNHTEKALILQPNELMKEGYERICKEMMEKIERDKNYSIFGSPLSFFNPILTAKYVFDDPAAENKICLDVYLCKDKVKHITDTKDFKVFGYALIYAYYNTEMYVSCWELFERSPRDVELLKGYIAGHKDQTP
ncbi:hypothetical protein AGMMS50230_02180 [Spirochaetia bacterium]|nr:hypothetical protein AGMMS50230_02180 [Spirochaetia bacterium]